MDHANRAAPGHRYRWLVRTIGTLGATSNWSATQSFYIAPLGTPGILGPVGASNYVNANSLVPTFVWSAVGAADSYDIRIADVTTGQAQFVRTTTTNTSLVSPSPLTLGHNYQWWVRGLNASGNSGPWSAGNYFSAIIAPPTVTGPITNLFTPIPTFTWSPVAGAISTMSGSMTQPRGNRKCCAPLLRARRS